VEHDLRHRVDVLRDVTRSAVYWAFVASGLLFVLIGVLVAKEISAPRRLPVTWQVLEMAGSTFSLFILITLTFYAGEPRVEERDAQVSDRRCVRVPTWVPFLSKLVALFLVTASLQLVIPQPRSPRSSAALLRHRVASLPRWTLIVFGVLQDVLIAVLALAVHV